MRKLMLACAALLVVLVPGPVAASGLRLLASELPPYTYQVPPATVAEFPGPGQGLVHEVVEELARRVGQSAVIEYVPWQEAQALAQTQPDIGILALTRTPEREGRYRWIAKIVTDDLVVVGGQGVDVSSLAMLRDRPVGVLRGSGAEVLLREQGLRRIVPAPEEWLNARRLRDRRIDAWLAPRLMVIHAYKEVGGDPQALAIGAIVRPSEIWFAASKGLPEAQARRWEQAFAAMQADGSYARILRKYENLQVTRIPDDRRREMSGPLWAFPY